MKHETLWATLKTLVKTNASKVQAIQVDENITKEQKVFFWQIVRGIMWDLERGWEAAEEELKVHHLKSGQPGFKRTSKRTWNVP